MAVRDWVKTMPSRTHSTLNGHLEVTKTKEQIHRLFLLLANTKLASYIPCGFRDYSIILWYSKNFPVRPTQPCILEYTMSVNHGLLKEDGVFWSHVDTHRVIASNDLLHHSNAYYCRQAACWVWLSYLALILYYVHIAYYLHLKAHVLNNQSLRYQHLCKIIPYYVLGYLTLVSRMMVYWTQILPIHCKNKAANNHCDRSRTCERTEYVMFKHSSIVYVVDNNFNWDEDWKCLVGGRSNPYRPLTSIDM